MKQFNANDPSTFTTQRTFVKFCICISFILYFIFGCTLHTISQTLGAAPIRKMSGAPVGDSSIMIYPPGGMTTSQNMTLATPIAQDSIKIHNVVGFPAFMHMYRVDAVPNTTCGLPSAMSNRYFGVFVPPGATTQYDIVYYYGGNPFVTPVVEPFLDIFKRNTNADTVCPAWSPLNAIFDFLADSAIKLSVVGRKEFIIDHLPENPLNIQLSYFNAEWLDEFQNRSIIQWGTEVEINCSHFIVEKSNNLIEWHLVDQISANGNVDQPMFYSTVDMNASDEITYYQLLQYDNDGTYTTYDPYMLKHNKCEEYISLYPNPVIENLYINAFRKKISFIRFQLLDMNGTIVFQKSFNLKEGYNTLLLNSISAAPGVYFANISENDLTVLHQKIMIYNR